MINVPYLHARKDKSSLINSFFVALIPLLLFSFYKNGILLYQHDLVHFSGIFVPLYFYVISVGVGILVSIILHEEKKENILICLTTACTISINTNMIIYPILLFASYFIIKVIAKKYDFQMNYVLILHLALLLALFMNLYSYLNVAEKLSLFEYNLFDIFLGHTSGGIAATSLLFLIISMVILTINPYYKKRVLFSATLSYIVMMFIILFISHNTNYLDIICGGNAYFSFAFVATSMYTFPNTDKNMIIYGIFVGLLTAILTLVFKYEAPYLSILLIDLFLVFWKVIRKKHLQTK